MHIPVFRKGTWISYNVPSDVERYWTTKLKFQAASVYASAIVNGYSPQEASVYAEMWVNKQLYQGLTYDAKYENIFKRLLV